MTTVLDLYNECENKWGDKSEWDDTKLKVANEILAVSKRSVHRISEVSDIDAVTILTEEEVTRLRGKIANI